MTRKRLASCRRSPTTAGRAGERAARAGAGAAPADVITGEGVSPLPDERDDVVVNNRLRRELGAAVAAFKLSSPDRNVRLGAVKELADGVDQSMLPLVKRALAKEPDGAVRSVLESIEASLELEGGNRG